MRDISVLIGEPRKESVVLETGNTVVPGLGLIKDATILTNCAKEMQQGLFNVLFLGSFKSGKSTLINALLGSEMLPVKLTPTTALITVLIYGERKDVVLYKSNTQEPQTFNQDDFQSEYLLNKKDLLALDNLQLLDRLQQIEYAQIECLHPLCANGVKLIDSPGLSESTSLTKLTTKFIVQADAVIFVLRATQLMSLHEQEFIEFTLSSANLNHVFFIVNYIDLIDDEDDLNELKYWLKRLLKRYFLNDKSEFDEEFYNRRVFFVSAKKALDARLTEKNKMLQKSGILFLERELEQFLTTHQKFTAALENTIKIVANITITSHRQITQHKLALDQPLNELEGNRQQLEKQVQNLKFKESKIEDTILRYGEIISQRIYYSLMNWLDEMHRTWPEDSKKLINADELSLISILESSSSEGTKQRIADVLSREIKIYLEVKLSEWSRSLPNIISDILETMESEIEIQFYEFQSELAYNRAVFSGIKSEYFIEHLKQEKMVKLVDFPNSIRSLTQRIVILSALSLFSPAFAIVPIAYSIIGGIGWFSYFRKQEKNFKEKILKNLGNELHEKLKSGLDENRDDIYQNIQQQFTQIAQNLTDTLQTQVYEIRAEQDKILEQKHNIVFSLEEEKKRLDIIADKLLKLLNKVMMAVYGKNYSFEEIEQFIKKNSL